MCVLFQSSVLNILFGDGNEKGVHCPAIIQAVFHVGDLFRAQENQRPKKLKKLFFKDKFYSLKVDGHYFTVFIYLTTWSGAKLGIFTNFTFTNLPSCCLSMNSLIYVYFIQISSCFFWVLNHSCDHTSSYHHRPKKFSVLSPDCIVNYKTELISKD